MTYAMQRWTVPDYIFNRKRKAETWVSEIRFNYLMA